MNGEAYADLFVTAGDGLRLYARDYRPPSTSDRLPVVCLPGLTRNSEDSHDLALALAQHGRRVLALDYRGRGRSAWDPDWRNYDLKVEAGDVLHVLTAAGVHEAAFVGTSRGGLIAMALAAVRPALLRGVVLNDIGPVIEAAGLARIRGYVGKIARPETLDEGAAILRASSGAEFPALTPDDWRAWARGTWTERGGRLDLAYDPALARTLDGLDPETPPAPLWPLFGVLKHVPVLTLRGETSDILSPETLAAMATAHPSLEAETVPGQGHAPLLNGPALIERIAAFIDRIDEGRNGTVISPPGHGGATMLG